MSKGYKIIEDGVRFEYRVINGVYRKFCLEPEKQPKRLKKPKKVRKTKSLQKKKPLTSGQIWWRSLTLQEQTNWRYKLMLKRNGKADWNYEYEQCKKEGLYKR